MTLKSVNSYLVYETKNINNEFIFDKTSTAYSTYIFIQFLLKNILSVISYLETSIGVWISIVRNSMYIFGHFK